MTHLSHIDGDNTKDENAKSKEPVRPDELQVPEGVEPLLGSEHDKDVNRQLL